MASSIVQDSLKYFIKYSRGHKDGFFVAMKESQIKTKSDPAADADADDAADDDDYDDDDKEDYDRDEDGDEGQQQQRKQQQQKQQQQRQQQRQRTRNRNVRSTVVPVRLLVAKKYGSLSLHLKTANSLIVATKSIVSTQQELYKHQQHARRTQHVIQMKSNKPTKSRSQSASGTAAALSSLNVSADSDWGRTVCGVGRMLRVLVWKAMADMDTSTTDTLTLPDSSSVSHYINLLVNLLRLPRDGDHHQIDDVDSQLLQELELDPPTITRSLRKICSEVAENLSQGFGLKGDPLVGTMQLLWAISTVLASPHISKTWGPLRHKMLVQAIKIYRRWKEGIVKLTRSWLLRQGSACVHWYVKSLSAMVGAIKEEKCIRSKKKESVYYLNHLLGEIASEFDYIRPILQEQARRATTITDLSTSMEALLLMQHARQFTTKYKKVLQSGPKVVNGTGSANCSEHATALSSNHATNATAASTHRRENDTRIDNTKADSDDPTEMLCYEGMRQLRRRQVVWGWGGFRNDPQMPLYMCETTADVLDCAVQLLDSQSRRRRHNKAGA